MSARAAIGGAGDGVKLAIGVDFGTYASGFAYSKLTPAAGPARVSTHERWPDQPTADPKTRTAVLYQGTRLVRNSDTDKCKYKRRTAVCCLWFGLEADQPDPWVTPGTRMPA